MLQATTFFVEVTLIREIGWEAVDVFRLTPRVSKTQ